MRHAMRLLWRGITRRPEGLGLGVALVILTTVAALAYRSIDSAQDTLGWAEHGYRVLQQIDELSSAYARSVSARRAYLVAGDASELADAADFDDRMAHAIAALRSSVADNPGQLRRLDSLAPLLERRIALLKQSTERPSAVETGSEAAEGFALATRIRDLEEEMAREENQLLVVRDVRTLRNLATSRVMTVLGTVTSFAILLLAFGRLRRELAQRRHVASRLRVSKEAAEAANRDLESFSYSVAHDLRAPLRAIDGFGHALEEDYAKALDGPGLKHLARMRAAAQHMALVIDSLLRLSRVARADLVCTTVDLTSLARESAARLVEGDPERRVEIVVQEGLVAECDPALLTAALDNLLGNAWKFTRKCAHPRVEVGSELRDGMPAFFVRDNGAGFEQAYAQRLFGAFQRLHSATEFEGTGIGLATVDRIVRRHGGSIRAQGEPGRGATFSFTLSPDSTHSSNGSKPRDPPARASPPAA